VHTLTWLPWKIISQGKFVAGSGQSGFGGRMTKAAIKIAVMQLADLGPTADLPLSRLVCSKVSSSSPHLPVRLSDQFGLRENAPRLEMHTQPMDDTYQQAHLHSAL